MYEMSYINSLEHGSEILYKEDGSKMIESTCETGKMHGTSIQYYEDGSKRSETPFMNGKMQGMAIMYNKDGTKKSVIRKRQSDLPNSNPPRSPYVCLRSAGPILDG